MKKFLASILALTMIFSLVGGISSFAEEMNDYFEKNDMVGYSETAKEGLKRAKAFFLRSVLTNY